jgi:hypothetical protein
VVFLLLLNFLRRRDSLPQAAQENGGDMINDTARGDVIKSQIAGVVFIKSAKGPPRDHPSLSHEKQSGLDKFFIAKQ